MIRSVPPTSSRWSPRATSPTFRPRRAGPPRLARAERLSTSAPPRGACAGRAARSRRARRTSRGCPGSRGGRATAVVACAPHFAKDFVPGRDDPAEDLVRRRDRVGRVPAEEEHVAARQDEVAPVLVHDELARTPSARPPGSRRGRRPCRPRNRSRAGPPSPRAAWPRCASSAPSAQRSSRALEELARRERPHPVARIDRLARDGRGDEVTEVPEERGRPVPADGVRGVGSLLVDERRGADRRAAPVGRAGAGPSSAEHPAWRIGMQTAATRSARRLFASSERTRALHSSPRSATVSLARPMAHARSPMIPAKRSPSPAAFAEAPSPRAILPATLLALTARRRRPRRTGEGAHRRPGEARPRRLRRGREARRPPLRLARAVPHRARRVPRALRATRRATSASPPSRARPRRRTSRSSSRSPAAARSRPRSPSRPGRASRSRTATRSRTASTRSAAPPGTPRPSSRPRGASGPRTGAGRFEFRDELFPSVRSYVVVDPRRRRRRLPGPRRRVRVQRRSRRATTSSRRSSRGRSSGKPVSVTVEGTEPRRSEGAAQGRRGRQANDAPVPRLVRRSQPRHGGGRSTSSSSRSASTTGATRSR